MLHNSKRLLLAVACIVSSSYYMKAQTEVSGFYPKKNELTVAPSYTYKSYDRFYRGDVLTDGNPAGMGDISSNIVNLYGEYGINEWLSTSLNLPYINVENENNIPDPVSGESSSNGIQDINVFVKGKILDKEAGKLGKLALGAAAGIGIPLSNYEGRGIISIGTNANSYTGNAIAQLTTKFNVFLESQAGYSIRESSDYDVPNAMVYGFKLGYFNQYFYIHSQLAIQNSIDGLDIATPEWVDAGGPAALPQTEVDFTNLNFNLYIPLIQDKAGVSTSFNTTLNGRNVNKEQSYSIGLVYKSF